MTDQQWTDEQVEAARSEALTWAVGAWQRLRPEQRTEQKFRDLVACTRSLAPDENENFRTKYERLLAGVEMFADQHKNKVHTDWIFRGLRAICDRAERCGGDCASDQCGRCGRSAHGDLRCEANG